MAKAIKPSKAITIDMAAFEHSALTGLADVKLFADAQRLGIETEVFRNSVMCGRIAAYYASNGQITQTQYDAAIEVLTLANPEAKGDKPKRTESQQKAYDAARTWLSRWAKAHNVKRANAARGKPGQKTAKATPKPVTPQAVNQKQAETYIFVQAAAMKAYAEKNAKMLPQALLHAIGEFYVAVGYVKNERETEEKLESAKAGNKGPSKAASKK